MHKKLFTIVCLVITFLSVFVSSSFAYENKIIIEDDANLLSSSEEEDLYELMEKISEFGSVMLKTIDINSSSTRYYAENYYYNQIGNESGVLFLIDMDNREIYIASSGTMYNTITKSKADSITDNVYRYATRSDYYQCAEEAFKEVFSLLNGKKIAEPMKVICNIILAFMFALLINYGIFKIASKVKKTSGKEILEGAEGYFENEGSTACKTGQHKEYSPQSSGSSSSGGGFSGGGRWRRPEVSLEEAEATDSNSILTREIIKNEYSFYGNTGFCC